MRVLGIDPGLGRTGIALVEGAPGRLSLEHASRLDTVPQTSQAVRLANLYEIVLSAVRDLRPDVAALEQLFLSTNRRTAMRVSEARGVILCALGQCRVQVVEYTPNQVKQAVCGHGAARKPQVARMVLQILGRTIAEDDVADACAIAVCHHHRGSLLTQSHRARAGGATPLDIAVSRARARLQAITH